MMRMNGNVAVPIGAAVLAWPVAVMCCPAEAGARTLISALSILGLHTVVLKCSTFQRALAMLVSLLFSSYRSELQFLWSAAEKSHRQGWLALVGILHLALV
jgi:hypothetical protein